MNLIIKIENPQEDRNTPDDIQMLKEILKRSGVTMRAEDSFGSKSVYRLRGREEKNLGKADTWSRCESDDQEHPD